jgi:hypothetical protein
MASSNDTVGGPNSRLSLGVIIGSVVGGVAVLAALGAVLGICLARRKRAVGRMAPSTDYPMTASGVAAGAIGSRGMRTSDSSAFIPLRQDNQSTVWNASTTSLPYHDDVADGRGSAGLSMDRDPYAASTPMQPHGYLAGAQQYRY